MVPNQESLEQRVIHLVQGGWRSREVLEAEYPERAGAIDEDRVMLCGWSTVVHREGLALANLALSPSTRAELLAKCLACLRGFRFGRRPGRMRSR